jgi:dipeptidyl aminopeptidase/acylaminoacyl peptidase
VAATVPYGAWASPISAELVAAGGVSLDEVRVARDGVYWVEGRPLEGGRQVICRAEPGGPGVKEVTTKDVNARTRVHEYGGGSYALHGGAVFFSNFADQRLYRQDPGSAEARPITPEPPAPAAHRYADTCPTPDGRLLVCVRERHQDGEVVNELVAVPADGGGEPVVLAAGRDFYASPRVSPDGRRLAWLEWDHPNIPWDGTELRLAELAGDRLAGDPVTVAGSPTAAPAVVLIDPAGGGVELLRSSEERELDPGYLSVPEPIEFPTEGGRSAHALYYPPADFAAGASYYGVADAAALARDTHKFESRYLDRLIGPWPEAEALYRERSPIHFTDRLSCPVILLQGLEDEVVPPAQAEMMAAALDAKGIPYAYLPFGGEQHGFRQAAHIRRALEAELYFYSRVFGFDLADPVEPVAIAHL